MFYVYVLKSEKDGNLYIGSTNDLGRRLNEHNNGLVFSAKSRKPFELVYYERIICNETELNKTREYISSNPLNWESDENFVSATKTDKE
jgi:putative endonuclease